MFSEITDGKVMEENPFSYEERQDLPDEVNPMDHEERLKEDYHRSITTRSDESAASMVYSALTQVDKIIHFKEKYKINLFHESTIPSILYKILIRLDKLKCLHEIEIKWLKNKNLFLVVAQGYLQRYQKYGKGWDLAKGSRFFRKARMPYKSLLITEAFKTTDKELMSAILTTRGAAFKDVGYLDNAEACAWEAINQFPNRKEHPYYLLGSIYVKRGQYAKAMKYFDEAKKFGATHKDISKTIESEIDSIEEIERRLMAIYLIEENPIRFG